MKYFRNPVSFGTLLDSRRSLLRTYYGAGMTDKEAFKTQDCYYILTYALRYAIFLANLAHSECLVNTKLIKCQAKLEMSYSYQIRNVLFSGLRFNGSSSFITMFTRLESKS
jgi:hypothetical protein